MEASNEKTLRVLGLTNELIRSNWSTPGVLQSMMILVQFELVNKLSIEETSMKYSISCDAIKGLKSGYNVCIARNPKYRQLVDHMILNYKD